jgi:hypothetical protein
MVFLQSHSGYAAGILLALGHDALPSDAQALCHPREL